MVHDGLSHTSIFCPFHQSLLFLKNLKPEESKNIKDDTKPEMVKILFLRWVCGVNPGFCHYMMQPNIGPLWNPSFHLKNLEFKRLINILCFTATSIRLV